MPDPATIALIGPYPPPYGGVSTHIQRLRCRLKHAGFAAPVWRQPSPDAPADSDDDIHLLPARRRPACYAGWLLDSRRRIPADIAHFHELRAYALWALATLRRQHRVVITVHNQFVMEDRRLFSRLSQWAVRRAAGYPGARFIAVNPRISRQLQELGVPAGQVSVVPAYLPPPVCQSTDQLPRAIRTFAAQHRPLMTVYGIRCERTAEWGDLYGFETAIRTLANLRLQYPYLGLVVLSPGNGDRPYLRELKQLAVHLGVPDRVLWWVDPIPEASSLWALSDVYLRPTATDGDALAVREALDRGVPVVATDVCERPQGTRVTPPGNAVAFAAAVSCALAGPRPTPGVMGDFGFRAVMNVYAGLRPDLMAGREPAL